MKLLSADRLVISISGTSAHVISTFLRVFLANERLADKQFEVATVLVSKYAKYVTDGVKEPYASVILFSTETRKEMCDELKMSAAHLNITFEALMMKNVLCKDDGKYQMNPNIVPSSMLTFRFKIDG